MKYVYIAGPYRGADRATVAGYIYMAARALRRLAELGIGAFCPHMNSAHFEEYAPTVYPEYWLEMDLHFLDACDGLVLVDGWRRSEGALAEIDRARELGIPVWDVSESQHSAMLDASWRKIERWSR